MYDITDLIKSLSSYLADLAVPESLAASSALELFVVPASIIRNANPHCNNQSAINPLILMGTLEIVS